MDPHRTGPSSDFTTLTNSAVCAEAYAPISNSQHSRTLTESSCSDQFKRIISVDEVEHVWLLTANIKLVSTSELQRSVGHAGGAA